MARHSHYNKTVASAKRLNTSSEMKKKSQTGAQEINHGILNRPEGCSEINCGQGTASNGGNERPPLSLQETMKPLQESKSAHILCIARLELFT